MTRTSNAAYAKSISNAADNQTVPVSAPTRHWWSKGIARGAQSFCLWVHYLRSGAEANGSFCKLTECPLGNRHHLKSLGAAYLLRLLKNSQRGPQEVESVEEGERVETVEIACRLKKKRAALRIGPTASHRCRIFSFEKEKSCRAFLGARQHYNCSAGVRDVGAVALPIRSKPLKMGLFDSSSQPQLRRSSKETLALRTWQSAN